MSLAVEFNDPAFVREFAELVRQLEIKSALEIGCRSGELLAALCLQGIECHGIEIDPAFAFEASLFLERMRCPAEVEAVAGGIQQYRPRKKWDMVYSSGLLEHFPRPEAVEIIRQMARLAGKWVVNLAPNADCLPYRAAKARGGHEWCSEDHYTTQELARLHEAAGLTVWTAGTMATAWGTKWDPTVICGTEQQAYLVCVVAEPRK